MARYRYFHCLLRFWMSSFGSAVFKLLLIMLARLRAKSQDCFKSMREFRLTSHQDRKVLSFESVMPPVSRA